MGIDRETAIKLAREAGFKSNSFSPVIARSRNGTFIDMLPEVEALVRLVAQRAAEAERKACAKLCIERYAARTEGGFPREASSARACAEDIRARGTTKEKQG